MILFYQNICKKLKIEFISTPYTLEDAKFLTTLKLKTIKTASADIVDHKLHHYLSSKKAKVIILSHIGRPNGQIVDGMSLEPISKKISFLVKKNKPIDNDAK